MYRITSWPNFNINFWSITKCANTAMKIHLYELTNGEISLHRDTDINKHLKFISAEEAANNNFINFTICRNPYTRFLSAYNYIRYKRPKKLKDIGLPKECTVDQLIEFLFCNRDNEALDPHLKKQINFINHNVHNIIHIENIQEEWNINLPILGVSKNVNTRKQLLKLSKTQKALVYNWYSEDFTFFNYEK
jgi:hypothetical protein